MRQTLPLQCLALLGAFSLAAPTLASERTPPPLGQPYENYDPPFSRTSAVRAWRTAMRDAAGQRAADIARRLANVTAPGSNAQAEAMLLLGLAQDSLGRHSEAEDSYRLGLGAVRSILDTAAALGTQPPATMATSDRARQWARYLELHLRECLAHQRRFAEADTLPSLLGEPTGEPPERGGLGGMVGLATLAVPDPAVERELSADQVEPYRELVAAGLSTDMRFADPDRAAALRRLLEFEVVGLGTDHRVVNQHRILLGQQLAQAGDYAQAMILARQAQASLVSEPASAELADAYYLSGWIGHATHDYVAAQRDFEAALTTGADDPAGAMHIMAGATAFALQDPFRAQRAYRTALAAPRLSIDLRQQIGVLLGQISLAAGDAQQALADFGAVCEGLVEEERQTTRGTRSAPGDAALLQRRIACGEGQLAAWLLRGHDASAGAGVAEGALLAIQQAHHDPVADRIARVAARAYASRHGVGTVADELDDAVAARNALRAGATAATAGVAFAAAERPTDVADDESLTRRIAALATGLAANAPDYWARRMPTTVTLAQLQGGEGAAPLLRDGELLIAFHLPQGDRTGYVVAAHRGGAALAPIAAAPSALRTMIDRLRTSVDPAAYGLAQPLRREGIGARPFDRQTAYRLYQALLGDPAIQQMVQAATTLIFVPSGPLVSLPPAMLVTAPPSGGNAGDDDDQQLRETPWLVRTHAIVVLPSVASLRLFRQDADRPARPASLLALVNPAFRPANVPANAPPPAGADYDQLFVDGVPDTALLQRLPRLGFAQREGEALRQMLDAPSGSVLSGLDASRARLFAESDSGRLAQVRVLDLATHGFAAGPADGSSEPTLVLAAAPEPRQWVLTASDAATLRIDADWVILSACNSASPNYGATGLSGFAEGFFGAGARALLVSHWRVDDFSAAHLVTATIEHYYSAGQTHAAALRSAILDLLDNADLGRAHPAFWAPLVLIGDPG